ncbi:bacteriocin [Paraflavitalea sp. CAU 1676]|uniref:bacteriocin n=1 Tax=Paraflavitalea sp. CAU 1676 TaxID=3032598 RepID=UPI0023DA4207|nr:bacteriocin [Paraflavitalea sp. CAU 1676]MDF2187536.1 bacteriocin [Paraflavitalea sp. CAU 1676]
MKNNQFSPLTEQEMMNINGGGPFDGIPILGPLLETVLNTVKQLLASLGLPVNLPI